jgi:anti-anti-sigma factor
MPIRFQQDGDVTILTPGRTGDSHPEKVLIACREEIRKLLADGPQKVVVDLSDIDFLTSTEVGSMIGAVREAGQAQGAILFAGLGTRLVEILEVMRTLEILPIRLSPREAAVELSKVRLKEVNQQSRLVANNPTAKDIHAWCDARVPQLTHPPSIGKGAAVPIKARPEDEETLFGSGSPQIAAAKSKIDDSTQNTWSEALDIIERAQILFERHGLPFQPSLTFQDFLGQLSMNITRRP